MFIIWGGRGGAFSNRGKGLMVEVSSVRGYPQIIQVMDDHDVRLKPMLFGRLSHFKKTPYGSHGAFSLIIYDDLPNLNIVDFPQLR